MTTVKRMPLAVRLVADYTDTSPREPRFHPQTGQRYLADPVTGDPNPWPLAGVRVEGEAPAHTRVPVQWVARGISEGWLRGSGERRVHRPGGPPDDQWRVTHTFVHYDTLTLSTLDQGELVYTVVHQPDKYADHSQATYPERVDPFTADDTTAVTPDIYNAGATRVDWFYDLTLGG